MCEQTVSTPTVPVYPAEQLSATERQQIALDVLAGACTVTYAAEENDVSRKFVYQQVHSARLALDQAFDPEAPCGDDKVLFTIPVTKAWLTQLILALVLVGHCSFRGVIELLRDLFDYPISIGTVHNIVHRTISVAEQINSHQELSSILVGAHDEIFQAGDPVLVGIDVHSTYCYLLSQEEHRDGDTWGILILDLKEQGFAPKSIVGDAGSGMRSGHEQTLDTTDRLGDHFHVFYETTPLLRFLDNRAYDAIATVEKLERELAREEAREEKHQQTESKKQKRVQANEATAQNESAKATKHASKPSKEERVKQLDEARQTQRRAIELADDVRLLVTWLRQDVMGVAGPDHATRCKLYDFIVEELQKREEQCPHRIGPIRRMLANQRKEVLGFAAKLDREIERLAKKFGVPQACVREVVSVLTLPERSSKHWQLEGQLWQRLGGRYWPIKQAVAEMVKTVVRASSVVENLNSRLRNYFFLRRQLGQGYLELLRFFLNHRRFLRSEHAERVGKSPAELLIGQEHPHWLEMLGYKLFRRDNAA